MICPICKERKTHGDWWTCKACTKLPTERYFEEMINYYNNTIDGILAKLWS